MSTALKSYVIRLFLLTTFAAINGLSRIINCQVSPFNGCEKGRRKIWRSGLIFLLFWHFRHSAIAIQPSKMSWQRKFHLKTVSFNLCVRWCVWCLTFSRTIGESQSKWFGGRVQWTITFETFSMSVLCFYADSFKSACLTSHQIRDFDERKES